ncbi:thioredoxin [Candidatus Saccharibacteria bacterium]|nr:thioredoxin [Candidatus Saccharibacteria bacterium]
MSVIELNSENFENEVLKSSEPVLVDFWADWCGPCQMMSPIVEELAKDAKYFKVGEVNIDDEDILAEKYEVSSIPCFIAFKDGREIGRSVGAQSKKKLIKLLGMEA